jgi:hypothetical protein
MLGARLKPMILMRDGGIALQEGQSRPE